MESSDWQPRLSTHRERSKYAFDNSLFCDVEFLVVDGDGNKVTVSANKYPLAVCSSVFAAMFYGKLAETKSPINIPDCTKEGLQEILRYAHSEEANLTGSNVMEVLYLAKKYVMPFLEEKCNKYIQNEVSPEDVLSILPQVQKIDDGILQKHLWEIVDKKTDQVVSSESFSDVSRELLFQVLKRDTLKVNELHLFQAVDKWVTKRIEEKELVCNGETKRAILGEEVIRLIRFPLMTQKEFTEVVLPCTILIEDELTELMSIFNDIPTTTGLFLQDKRSCKGDLLIADGRFCDYINLWGYGHGIRNALNLKVNKAVDLVGVRLFGSERKSYDVDLKIYKNIQPECVSTVSSSYTTENQKIDDLYYGFTVTLDEPVRLDPVFVYTVQAEIGGPQSWFGTNGKSIISAGDITITYQDASNFNNNHTTSKRGQFPSLILRRI